MHRIWIVAVLLCATLSAQSAKVVALSEPDATNPATWKTDAAPITSLTNPPCGTTCTTTLLGN